MGFSLSPYVTVREKDASGYIPGVATSSAGLVGVAQWGPCNKVVSIGTEGQFRDIFHTPNDDTATTYFSATNFLLYGIDLKFVRVVDEDLAKNAVSTGTAVIILNEDDYENNYADGTNSVGTWAAKYPGAIGNSLRVELCDADYVKTFDGSSALVVDTTAETIAITAHGLATGTPVVYSAGTGGTAVGGLTTATTYYVISATSGTIKLATSASNATAGTAINLSAVGVGTSHTITYKKYDNWAYKGNFDDAPNTSKYVTDFGGANDEMHVVVIDEDGLFSGTPGTVLERHKYLSKATDAKSPEGNSVYYKQYMNDVSQYVWWMDHPTGHTNWGTAAAGVTFTILPAITTNSLTSGVSGDTLDASTDERRFGLDLLADSEAVDISLLIAGEATAAEITYMVDNVAEIRKDCVVFFSPLLDDVVNVTSSADALDNVVTFRRTTTNVNSSYAFMTCNWKYQYDKYNDKFRWIPDNADIAGLCARTDETNDPWFSPAGLNRGVIKNATKLAWNPNKQQRDELYKNGINPVISKPGKGTVLWGDKTQLSKPSAFDRINVRRLFIVLEKAIATAAEFSLFELNDRFTRNQFVGMVEPFLRDVKGRRGIYEFEVVCDERNNPGSVIDRNEFVGDIYISPAKSINFITLNFIATRTGVDFNEVIGKV